MNNSNTKKHVLRSILL